MDFKQQIEAVLEPMAQSISKLCQIESVEAPALPGMPFGEGPAKALQAALELGREMGFETENFDNYVGHIDFGDADDMIGILAHVDVVPAGEGWQHDPWGGEISDGAIWGRGTLDDKGPAVVCLYAMKILKDMGIPLSKKVRMILGANEETNWGCMEHYTNVVKPKYPVASFSPDAEFPVTYAEKGIYQYNLVKALNTDVTIEGGNAYNAVASIASAFVPGVCTQQVQQQLSSLQSKCSFTVTEADGGVRIQSQGKGAHAAELGSGINAISGLMELLSRLQLTGEIEQLLNFYQRYIGLCIYGEQLGLADEDESGRFTCNVGLIEVKDGQARLCLDNRIPVTRQLAPVAERIKAICKQEGFSYEEVSATSPLYIPKDSPIVKTLMQAYQDVTKDTTAQPITAGGGTYSRCVPNCVAFGCLLPDQENTLHQANENLKLEHMKKWLEIYLEAIYRLAK